MATIVVTDAFWGDSGKGKTVAYLCKKLDADLAVRAGTGPNAGHSIYITNSEKPDIATHQLPCGFINDHTQVRVGSGVAVDPEIFLKEVGTYNLYERAKIDFRCPIIIDRYRKAEEKSSSMKKIGSTKSGTGYALAQFRLRKAKIARDVTELQPYVTDVAKEINEKCDRLGTIVVECSQGAMLSPGVGINYDENDNLIPAYPYCTSENCTASAAAAQIGLGRRDYKVLMVVKAVPSRVGSGYLPYEITEEEIDKRMIAEYGVTTGRKRRKASQIHWKLLEYAAMLNRPDEIALTFCDHFDPNVQGIKNKDELTSEVLELIRKVEDVTKSKVSLVETGKMFDDIIEYSSVL